DAVQPIVCLTAVTVNGAGNRILIDTQPTVKCERRFHRFAAMHAAEFQLVFVSVGAKGADAMTISDQKPDYRIIDISIESSRYFHSERRAGFNDFHATMSGISQFSYDNLSTSVSVTIAKRKRLERLSLGRLALRQTL